jgi:electron transport complex protein RnfB
MQAKAEHKLADLAAHTKGTENAPEVDRKRAIIEAALAKAKARQTAS